MAPSENRLTRMRQVTFDYAGARNISDVTGNVSGKGPFNGTLRHKGWRAKKITLPTAVEGHDPRVLAQAEVEL